MGGGGQDFWADRIVPSKKFKHPRSGKIKNICGKKRLLQKLLWGLSPIMPPPPPEKWHGLHVERKDSPHRKNTPIEETPTPPST